MKILVIQEIFWMLFGKTQCLTLVVGSISVLNSKSDSEKKGLKVTNPAWQWDFLRNELEKGLMATYKNGQKNAQNLPFLNHHPQES